MTVNRMILILQMMAEAGSGETAVGKLDKDGDFQELEMIHPPRDSQPFVELKFNPQGIPVVERFFPEDV